LFESDVVGIVVTLDLCILPAFEVDLQLIAVILGTEVVGEVARNFEGLLRHTDDLNVH